MAIESVNTPSRFIESVHPHQRHGITFFPVGVQHFHKVNSSKLAKKCCNGLCGAPWGQSHDEETFRWHCRPFRQRRCHLPLGGSCTGGQERSDLDPAMDHAVGHANGMLCLLRKSKSCQCISLSIWLPFAAHLHGCQTHVFEDFSHRLLVCVCTQPADKDLAIVSRDVQRVELATLALALFRWRPVVICKFHSNAGTTNIVPVQISDRRSCVRRVAILDKCIAKTAESS
mmetsp:Transcript_79209/g.131033  ORF Transcript_79209/g.131033 Transcript_79209/m.131033 type:complete len:229 (+) Transcript_79209:509-1195(+)